MKIVTLIALMSFFSIVHAEEVQLGPKVDYSQLEKNTNYNRGEKPAAGRGPASVGTTTEMTKNNDVVKKGYHINKGTNTYRDTMIQPKY